VDRARIERHSRLRPHRLRGVRLKLQSYQRLKNKMSKTLRIVYAPLLSAKKQIRTLTLRAGKVHDAIRCSLNIVSLVEKPAYEALSYTWGDAKHTAPIEVDGACFDATVNLERALRHFRNSGSDLTLWVDAGESSMYVDKSV
jgi:hypothetical protein